MTKKKKSSSKTTKANNHHEPSVGSIPNGHVTEGTETEPITFKIKANHTDKEEEKTICNGTDESVTTETLHKRKQSVTFEDEVLQNGDEIIVNETKKTEVNRTRARRTLTGVGKFTLLSEVPTNLSIVSSVLFLEKPGLTKDQLVTLLREKVVNKYYRFRSKVVNYSIFEEVDVDVEQMIRYERLDKKDDNAPMDEEEEEDLLRSKLSSFVNIPLDSHYPLWQAIVVENYSKGYVLFIRAHHCLGDGTSMALVFNNMCDNPVTVREPGSGNKGLLKSTTREKVQWKWTNLVFFWRFVTQLWFYFMFGLGCLLLAYKWTREILRGKDPKTHFKGELGLKKRIAFSSNKLMLDDVKRAAAPYKATINDIMLSCVAGALDRYTLRVGQSESAKKSSSRNHRIRVGIPVNVRNPTEIDVKPQNKFGFVIASVPINMKANPIKQLVLTKKNMDFNKRLPEQYVSYKMSQCSDYLPASVIRHTFEYLANYLTVVLTNIRGSETKSYICGREVKDIVGLVPPPSGVGLGVAIFSHNGKITVSFVTDDKLIHDPENLIRDFEDTFEQILQMSTANSGYDYVLYKHE